MTGTSARALSLALALYAAAARAAPAFADCAGARGNSVAFGGVPAGAALPPFSFTLGDDGSEAVLARASVTRASQPLDADRVLTTSVFYDAATGLVVTLEQTDYSNLYPAQPAVVATEWVLRFASNGSAPTPPLCAVYGLNMSFVDAAGAAGATQVRRAGGSADSSTDYQPTNETLTCAQSLVSYSAVPGYIPAGDDVGSLPAGTTVAEAQAACTANVQCAAFTFEGSQSTPTGEVYLKSSAGVVANASSASAWTSYTKAGDETYVAWNPAGGRSSDSWLPFFTLVDSGGTVGYTFSVGWSGSWTAAVRRGDGAGGACDCTQVWVRHDSGDGACPGICAPLEPGEAFRAMRLLRVAFPANTAASYLLGQNAHRRLLTKYKVPRGADGAVLGAITAALGWWGFPQCPSMTFESQASMIAALKASAAVEAYWLDASWFNGCFPDGAGNWQLPLSLTIDQGEFPSGTNRSLASLGAFAHSAPSPLQFVLWVEPERVAANTFIARAHPDFVIPPGGNLLNLGNASEWGRGGRKERQTSALTHRPPRTAPAPPCATPRAAALSYVTSFLQSVVSELDLDVLRLDFNTAPAGNWRDADAPNRSGLTQVRYVEGLYQMWDAVRMARPDLLVDNCASGGRRIDLETLSRSVPLWRSDYAQPGQSAESQQVETLGLSLFAPVNSGTTDRFDPYMWRSTGSVGKSLIFGSDVWARLLANATELASLRAAQAETQRLRALSIFGDLYPLFPALLDTTSCAGWQYHCDGAAPCGGVFAGAFVVFRRPAAPEPACAVRPFALIASGTYNVSFFGGYALDRVAELTGVQLGELSLPLDAGDSVLVEYTCNSGC